MAGRVGVLNEMGLRGTSISPEISGIESKKLRIRLGWVFVEPIPLIEDPTPRMFCRVGPQTHNHLFGFFL